VLVDGLARLAYQGYDSAGIAYQNGKGLEIYKTQGKIHELQQLLPAPAAFLNKADDIIVVPSTHPAFAPFVSVIPLPLLAYHVAVLKRCDVDQPRNLAKSVTVE